MVPTMKNKKLPVSVINSHSFTATKILGAKRDMDIGKRNGTKSRNSNVLYSKNTE